MATIPGCLIPSQRSLFSIPDEVVYLNCAYMAPLLEKVLAAGIAGVGRKASPWLISSADFFNESDVLRHRFGRLINAPPDSVALLPATSYGIAAAARNLPVAADQEILVLEAQFPSNYYAWKRLATRTGAQLRAIARPVDCDWTSAVYAALSERVAIVAVPNCHWSDGGFLDLEIIGDRCRALGVALVVDLTQSLGAFPFDAARVRPAFAVASAYKWLLGPYSQALMYVDASYHDGEPIEDNWIHRRGADRFSGVSSYSDEFADGARRYDVGERSNFALVPMTIAALDQLLEWGVANISHTLGRYNDDLAARLGAEGFRVYPRKYSAPHYLSIELPPDVPEGITARLERDQIYTSLRGRSLRLTAHLYNTNTDAARCVSSLIAHLHA